MCTKTRDRKLVEKIYARIMTKRAEEKWFDKDPAHTHTFEEIMDRFMKEHAFKRKPSRDKTYRQILVHLKKYFSGKKLSKITSDMISSYMPSRREEGVTNAMINRECAVLSKAFNLAVKSWGWMRINPCQNVSKYPEDNERDRWLTWEEEEGLLKTSEVYLNGSLKDTIVLALNTGMRQGEILDLKWNQVELDEGYILVQNTKTKSPRVVPLNNTVIQMLWNRRNGPLFDDTCEYVFATKNGTRIGTMNFLRSFRKAVKRAGIENFRFHDLRHTFATRLIQAGDQLLRVSQLLGHRQVTTTQRYAHHYLESLRSLIILLENLRLSRLTLETGKSDNQKSKRKARK